MCSILVGMMSCWLGNCVDSVFWWVVVYGVDGSGFGRLVGCGF